MFHNREFHNRYFILIYNFSLIKKKCNFLDFSNIYKISHTILKTRRANAIQVERTKKALCEKCLCFRNNFGALKSITRDCNNRDLFRNRDRFVNFKVNFNYTRHIFSDVYLIRSFDRFSLSGLQSSLEASTAGRDDSFLRILESADP